LLLTGSVQAYADMNNEGNVSGRVVDENGDPVAGATVHIQRVNIRNQLGRVNTTTDENGYYEFTNQTMLLEFRIQAVKEGVGSSPVTRHHLYFRGQNSQITIVIQSDADG
jgi:membrane protease subunit (stomatin/prohibitin family)